MYVSRRRTGRRNRQKRQTWHPRRKRHASGGVRPLEPNPSQISSSVHCMDDRCFCKANHGFEGSRGRSSDLRRGWGVGVGGVAPTYGLIDMCGALYQNLVQTKEAPWPRSEEHTSELQSLTRISYDVFCLKKKKI